MVSNIGYFDIWRQYDIWFWGTLYDITTPVTSVPVYIMVDTSNEVDIADVEGNIDSIDNTNHWPIQIWIPRS